MENKFLIIIDNCFFCDFHRGIEEMYCEHPVFGGAGGDSIGIITTENMFSVPEKCPLREQDVTLIYKYKNGTKNKNDKD